MRKYFLLFLVVLAALFFFNSIDNSPKPVAIIYDPLSNENELKPFEALLSDAGYDVTCYVNSYASVNSFKSIPKEASLIILRVHSSINQGNVGVFTGEHYSNEKHSLDQLVDNVLRAKTNQESDYYFALGSGFFYDYITELDGAQVLVLGCDATASDELAGVFLEKGASIFISWNGLVSLEHTDEVFIEIIKQIIAGVGAETAAKIALNQFGCDPYFKSSLICFKQ